MAGLKGRLLALSWTMPPLVFPRSLQISRSLRGLQARGWETTVVTVTPDAEPFATIDSGLQDFYNGAYHCIPVELREEKEPSPIWLRLWRRFRPPADIRTDNWVRRAARVMRREIRDGRHGAMITFAQPWVDHAVGLRLKRSLPDFPWIAHFSDPWVDSAYRQFSSETERAAALRQERDVIGSADAVIFVNQYTADLVMAKYPPEWQKKVHVVPHGMEPDLLPLLERPKAQEPVMRIVHTGNFYGHRKPDLVLRAVKALADARHGNIALRLELIGHADDALRQTATDLGVGGLVTFTGSKTYLESLASAQSADLLLLIDAPADTSVFLPSKIVDYFMLKRPILGITPRRGASAEALRGAGCPVIDPEDYDGILAALAESFQQWETSGAAGPIPSGASLDAFGIEQVAERFEAALLSASPKIAAAASEERQPPLLSPEGVAAVLDERRGRAKGTVTAMLWNSDASAAEALLARPDVESVILTGADPALADLLPDRCGGWNPAAGALTLPGRLSAELHYFVPGAQWPFGVKTTYHLMRRKVRHVVFHDRDLGTVRTSTAALLVAAGAGSLRYRFSRAAVGRLLDQSMPGFSVDVIRRNIAARPSPTKAVAGRVMLVTGSLGPGGSERQTANTLLGLKAAGVTDISLLCAQPLVPPYDFFYPALEEAAIPCLHLWDEALRASSTGELTSSQLLVVQAMGRLGVRRDAFLSYFRVFSERRPEIVHTWLDDINVTAGIAAVLAGVPKVVIGCRSLAPHNFPFHQRYMRPLYRLLAKQPNVTILNNSEAGARDYRQWAGLTADIRVIRNGFDFPALSGDREAISRRIRGTLGIPVDAALVGTIMRLSQEKQPDLWLDIAERTKEARTDAHFIIVGDGPMMADLKKRIESSSLKGSVSLLGRRHDAVELLAAMDVFLLTSSVEGLPNVVVEAQAEGVPVVASDVGGVSEVFTDGDTGVIIPTQAVSDFVDGILKVLKDPDLRKRARDRGPVSMRERFSVERMIKETIDVYGRTG